jgi:hypothetical protein
MTINIAALITKLEDKISNLSSDPTEKDLLLISKSVEALDNTTALKTEDINVSVQGYDGDTSKTDVAESRTANIDLLTYTEKYITVGMDGIINLSLGTVFTHAHAAGHSAFNLSNVPDTLGVTSGFILILTNDGYSTPMTWFTGSGSSSTPIKWPAGTPPTVTVTGIDIFTFTTPDSGVTWYGIPSGIGMA